MRLTRRIRRPRPSPGLVASLAAGLLLATLARGGAAQTVRVGVPVPVAAGLDERPLVEPHIAAHPSDPRHLLAATMIGTAAEEFADTRSAMRCAAFLSTDAGRSWARHDFPVTQCFDPWVVITRDGRAAFSALAVLPATGDRQLVVFHSPDGGRTWNDAPALLGRAHDHPTMVADWSDPHRAGRVYVVSSQTYRAGDGTRYRGISVARSRDAGLTFDAPVRLQPSNLFHNAEVPVVLSGGTIVASFIDTSWGDDDPLARRAWVVRSDDGESFSVPEHITDACGPPRFALSAMAADPSSGPTRDRLYYACNQLGGGAVVVAASSDTTAEWAAPVPVHAAPPADSGALRHVRAIAVNRDGVVGIVWADRWGEGDGPRCYQVFFAASTDGGRTWLPARRLTRGRACLDRAANGALVRAFPTGGDYYGLTAAADGRFHAVWPEPREGAATRIWTAPIEVERGRTPAR